MFGSPFTGVVGLKNSTLVRALVRGKNATPVRTVVVPYTPEEPLLRALRDVRSGVNQLVRDWRAHPEESRFEATRRSYRELRPRFRHLASQWSLAMCNECSATLRAWDKTLRRARRHDPARFERIRSRLPHRQTLKASLPRALYRLHGRVVDLTLRPDVHIRIDLSGTRNPLFWRYLESSNGEFGLAITDKKLVFNFRVPHDQPVVERSAGIDINMLSADWATTDGQVDLVDLSAIPRIQGAMARKRERIQRANPTDRKAQHRVMRRYRGRERDRVMPLLHRAANELLEKIGDRNVILEDLSGTTEDCIRRTQWNEDQRRRRLSTWTHGQLTRIISYKARTAILRVDPRGTSSTCPQCGGALHHPSWRRSDCGNSSGSPPPSPMIRR
jgi:IS605 OrfB family transposase